MMGSRKLWVLVLVGLLGLMIGPHPATAVEPEAKPPNVVLIISDDHAWTDYGFMGHPHVQTPRLDRLASESLTFSRGYVPSSLCCPSLASIITGLFPHQHKITSNDPPLPEGMTNAEFYRSSFFTDGREMMNQHIEAVPTLPRMLADRDYLSLQTGKWWQGHYSRGGFTHGMTRGQRHGDDGLIIGRETMEPIASFITEAKEQDRPFFVWYAPFLPHTPHNPPERFLKRFQDVAPTPSIARYWAMIAWFDETCGELIDLIDDAGLAEETIILYVSDNGWTQDPEGPGFVRSKRSPYDTGLRSPIMVRWPGRVEPRFSHDLAGSVDLAPTILAAVGLEPTDAMQGLNLLDTEAVARRQILFGANYEHNAIDLNDPAANLRERWVIDGPWKLIAPTELSDLDAPELYQLDADPAELQNLADVQIDRVRQLMATLDQWWTP